MEKLKSQENPNKKMSISAAGILAIKKHEKKMLRYYNDLGKSKGNCTYGYGTLVHYGICTEDELKIKVTEEMVEEALKKKIREFEGVVRRNVTYPLNQEQFDALVSFTYNLGPGGAMNTFIIINRGDLDEAASNIRKSITAKVAKKQVVVRGLIRRRKEESAPFAIAAKESKEEARK
jgi:lysozyme